MSTKRKSSERDRKLKEVTLRAITPVGCRRPVTETVPVALDRIVQALDPEKVILFGSYSYGTPTPDSDIDLLIIIGTEAASAERSWAVSRLLLPRAFPVDILVKTPDEIRSSLEAGDFFIREIVARGRVMYERPN